MTDKTITLQDIFHSSDDKRRHIDYGDMPDWLEAHAITIRRQPIDTPQTRHILQLLRRMDASDLQELTRLKKFVGVHGGGLHHALAMLAYYWLIDIGHSPKCEQTVNGRRVDVVSEDLSILIECGDTNAMPILDHLHKPAKMVCVVPFQDVLFVDSPPFMYNFERGEVFAAAYQEMVAAQVVDAVNRRHDANFRYGAVPVRGTD